MNDPRLEAANMDYYIRRLLALSNGDRASVTISKIERKHGLHPKQLKHFRANTRKLPIIWD